MHYPAVSRRETRGTPRVAHWKKCKSTAEVPSCDRRRASIRGADFSGSLQTGTFPELRRTVGGSSVQGVNAELVVDRVKYARLSLGLTRTEFATLTGVGLRSLEAWDAHDRDPSLKNIRRIARATDRPISWFLGLDEEEKVA